MFLYKSSSLFLVVFSELETLLKRTQLRFFTRSKLLWRLYRVVKKKRCALRQVVQLRPIKTICGPLTPYRFHPRVNRCSFGSSQRRIPRSGPLLRLRSTIMELVFRFSRTGYRSRAYPRTIYSFHIFTDYNLI